MRETTLSYKKVLTDYCNLHFTDGDIKFYGYEITRKSNKGMNHHYILCEECFNSVFQSMEVVKSLNEGGIFKELTIDIPSKEDICPKLDTNSKKQ